MSKELKHILCVDDEPDILDIAMIGLADVGGFQVTGCNDGQEGIERAMMLKPDLILLDMMMPEMDGVQTLAKIKEHAEISGIPVVFMTARAQPGEIEGYIKMGAAAVISKPFNPMTLSQKMMDIWKNLYGE